MDRIVVRPCRVIVKPCRGARCIELQGGSLDAVAYAVVLVKELVGG